MKVDLEKIKNIDFNSAKFKKQFKKIKENSKRILDSTKIDNKKLLDRFTI